MFHLINCTHPFNYLKLCSIENSLLIAPSLGPIILKFGTSIARLEQPNPIKGHGLTYAPSSTVPTLSPVSLLVLEALWANFDLNFQLI